MTFSSGGKITLAQLVELRQGVMACTADKVSQRCVCHFYRETSGARACLPWHVLFSVLYKCASMWQGGVSISGCVMTRRNRDSLTMPDGSVTWMRRKLLFLGTETFSPLHGLLTQQTLSDRPDGQSWVEKVLQNQLAGNGQWNLGMNKPGIRKRPGRAEDRQSDQQWLVSDKSPHSNALDTLTSSEVNST